MLPKRPGIVHLVGAGPGDPGLITSRGAEAMRRAQVVIYDGLINPALLDLAPREATRIYAGKKHAPGGHALAQEEINELLVEHGRAGKRVVRLKGGDGFVFGRGAEECEALAAAGIGFEVIPGVTAAIAVPAYAGIPLTARGAASTVAFATGHESAGKPSSDVDWEALARAGTVVLFMALRTLEDCCNRLMRAGRDPDTPAAAIYRGTTPAQKTVVGTLADLPARAAGLKPPVLVIVGPVVELRSALSWYENRPLFGAPVVIPRSPEQGRGFADSIAELGGEPIAMPVTRIAPPDAADRALMDRAAARLTSYDWVLFTSANSVTRFFAELWERGLDARALGRVACVGEATARAAREHGIFADLVPEQRDGAGVAAAILERVAAGRDRDAGLRVLFPRAAKGRDEAVDALRAAGAEVDLVPVYVTGPTPPDDPELGPLLAAGVRLLRDRAGALIAFFAPSQVAAVCDLLGPDAAAILAACPVVGAIGNTTRAALEERGVTVHVVAKTPDAGVLAADMAAYYQALKANSGRSG